MKPSEDTAELRHAHNLVPFQLPLDLSSSFVYIYGPFDFATYNGRKTRDRVAIASWQELVSRKCLFHNDAPEVADYVGCAFYMNTYQFDSLTPSPSVTQRVESGAYIQHVHAAQLLPSARSSSATNVRRTWGRRS